MGPRDKALKPLLGLDHRDGARAIEPRADTFQAQGPSAKPIFSLAEARVIQMYFETAKIRRSKNSRIYTMKRTLNTSGECGSRCSVHPRRYAYTVQGGFYLNYHTGHRKVSRVQQQCQIFERAIRKLHRGVRPLGNHIDTGHPRTAPAHQLHTNAPGN